MYTFTETRNETYHVVSCYSCGNPFGVTTDLHRRAVKDKEGVLYCPSCGKETQWVSRTDDQKRIDELKRKLKWAATELTRQIVEKEAAQNSLRATKGVVTKIKKRVHNGVCPCCNRSFENLERHMKAKHPDFLSTPHS